MKPELVMLVRVRTGKTRGEGRALKSADFRCASAKSVISESRGRKEPRGITAWIVPKFYQVKGKTQGCPKKPPS